MSRYSFQFERHTKRGIAERLLSVALAGVALLFLALHYVHLRADFPNQSPWMDWSKYTDEGWYGDGAIRHYQLGHWYLAGDFNPAVALPVLPVLEGLVFHFSGVSLVAARALSVSEFAMMLLLVWCLMMGSAGAARGTVPRRPGRSTAAALTVALLAVSPFCFVFTRLAITEPLLVLLMLGAMLAAGSTHAEVRQAWTGAIRQSPVPICMLGLLMPLMVLTKTTAVFLLPAVGWMAFAAVDYQWRAWLRVMLPAGAIAMLLWGSYFFVAVRPHFLLDYRYLFSANAYTRISRENFLQVLRDTAKGGLWIGTTLYAAALVAVAISLIGWRRLASQPLIVSLLLWVLGYAAFLAYHNNIQPRYYLVVAVPLTLLTVLVAERIVWPWAVHHGLGTVALLIMSLLFATILTKDARQTLEYVRHPQYTLLEAARQVHDYIAFDRRVDPRHSPLVLSISGSEFSLMTGMPSIDDDFGTLELPDRIRQYKPGWYLAWNQIDDDKMDAITPIYTPVRVATFPAMDDPDRNVLVLYRLEPPGTSTRHPRKPTPRQLRTRVGQQPSTNQLTH